MPTPPEILNIVFDPVTGRMQVGGFNIQNQEQKDHAVQLLLSAMHLILNIKLSVIQPAVSMPGEGNGKIPLKLTH